MTDKNTTDSLYRINRLTGEFTNRQIESKFTEISWPGISKKLIIAFILCAANFLLSNNIQGPGEFPQYRTLIVPITKGFAVFLLAAAVAVKKSRKYYLWLQIVVSLSEIFIGLQSAANHYFFLTYINKFYDIGTSFIVFYILIFYIVVPNRLLTILITNVTIAVLFTFITNLSGLTSFSDIFSISMYFAIANALGYVITLSNNRARREEYHQRIQLRAAQDEAIDARKMAEEANSAKSRFLAMINHEMRTPLNVVVGGIQILENDGLNAGQQDTLTMIKNSGELLKDLIRNVLDFTDMERNQIQIRSEIFLLDDLFKELQNIYTLMAEENKIDFILTDELNEFRPVEGDPMRLRQILTNLLNNAFKFTRDGSVCLKIAPEAADDSQLLSVRFSVIDTGIGISEDQFTEIIKPFTQVEQTATRNFDGSGLGLAICSELLNAMGSRLEISSKEDSGSTFSFILSFKISKLQSGAVSAIPETSCKILLIDDISANLKIAGKLLEALNQSVVCCSSGQEGIEKISNEDIDIVFIDFHMPEMDGFETLKRIKQKKPDITAFLMTADTREEILRLGEEAGFSGIINKPIDSAQLYEAVAERNLNCNSKNNKIRIISGASKSIDTEYLLQIKKDLGEEVFADVIKSCIKNLEDTVRLLEDKESGYGPQELIHQLLGVAGNYRLNAVVKTLKTFRSEPSDFNPEKLTDQLRTAVNELKELIPE